MTKDDGGPAYPTFTADRVYRDDGDRIGRIQHVPQGGMSLRDYFAGQYLAGRGRTIFDDDDPGAEARVIARIAYILADAMLKARKR